MRKHLALLLAFVICLSAFGFQAVGAADDNLLAGLSYTFTKNAFQGSCTDDNSTLFTDGAYRGDGTVAYNGASGVPGTTVEVAGTYFENVVEFAFDDVTSVGTIVIRNARACLYDASVNRHCTVAAVKVTTDGLNYTGVSFVAEYVAVADAPEVGAADQSSQPQYYDIHVTVEGAADIYGLSVTLTTERADGSFGYIVQLDEIEAYAPGVEAPFRGAVAEEPSSEDASVEVSEDASVEVSEDASVEVSEDASVEVSVDTSVEVSEDASVEVSEDASVEVSEDASVEVSEEVSVEVSEEVSEEVVIAATTYTVTITENGDGTVTVVATVPADIESGKIVVSVSADLELVAGSLTASVMGSTLNENYNRKGVVGAANSFAGVAANPEGTVAFSATYNVVEGATVDASDVTVPEWNLSSNGTRVGTQDDGDVNKIFVPFPVVEDSSEEPSVEVSEDVSVEVSEDVSVEVSEDVSVEVSEDVSVEVSEDVSVEVSEDVSVDSSDDVNCDDGHTYNEKWEIDDENHWHICDVCGEKVVVSNHKYENNCDLDCSICGYVRVIDDATAHTYTNNCDTECDYCGYVREIDDATAHTFDNACDTECNYCDFVREIKHDFADTWEDDAKTHWHVCSVCGEIADLAEHEYDNSCDTTCNVCEAVRPIEHTYTEEWTYDETNHWHECTVCHESVIAEAEHVYDHACDTDCNVCGAVREIEHAYSDIWSQNETNHWHECTVCGDKVLDYAHSYDADCDTDCNVCGYVRVIDDATAHTYDNNCDPDCAYCDYVREITEADHTFDHGCDTDCNVCDYTRVTEHVYSNDEWFHDADNHWHECIHCGDAVVIVPHSYDHGCDADCNICGEVRTTEHEYTSDEWFSDADNHWHECIHCGEKLVIVAHSYDNTCDTDCNVCGATREIEHTYDNACDADCNVCGDIREVGEHVYDDTCTDADCNICGAIREVGHDYDADEWFKDDDQHWHICDVCGAVVENEAHDYVDGNCVCGAVEVLLGDVNGDGSVDNTDAALILAYDIGLSDEIAECGDVNGDGVIDNTDASIILKYDAGIIESL